MSTLSLTRREFGLMAAALIVDFTVVPGATWGEEAKLRGSLEKNRALDSWLRIHADGSALIFTGKVELGQGIVTALAQIAAEELDLSLSRIEMLSGDTAQTPNEGYTSGSQSIEHGGTAVRLACAHARQLLLERAAAKLGVAAEALMVADGVIGAPDGRKIGYGDLVAEIAWHQDVTVRAPVRSPTRHAIVGQPIARRDIPAKVTGGAAYVQDLRIGGMLHGRVIRPPRTGAQLDSVDVAAAQSLPGVVAVVRDGSFLGVVAAREEQAVKARESLVRSARWSGGRDLPDPAALHDYLLSLPRRTLVISEKKAPVPPDAQILEARYTRPYLAHGSIGVRACPIRQCPPHGLHAFTGCIPVAARSCQGAQARRERSSLHPC